MKTLFLALLAFCCWDSAAAREQCPEGDGTGSSPSRALVEQLLHDFVRSWEIGDTELFLSTLHEDFTFAYPRTRTDSAGALDVFELWRENYANTKFYIHQLLVDCNRFAVEYQFATTRKATGKRSVVGTVSIGSIRDGKLYVVKEYLDGRVSRLQEAGKLPLDEGAEPYPWPLVPEASVEGDEPGETTETGSPAFPPPPATMPGAQTFIYRTVDGFSLPLFVFSAPEEDESGGTPRPAILFFHGSGWRAGTVRQFAGYARLLADHGLVPVLVEYRVKERYSATPFDAVADAKAAIRWVRQNAASLGIDPDRLIASGASAGGHIALAAAIFDVDSDDPAVSARPNALVLFAPVVNTTSAGYEQGVDLFNGRQRELSPIHHLGDNLPPTLIFQGTEDRWVDIRSVKRFMSRCRRLGNECTLVPFSGRNHHFYNDPEYFEMRPHLVGPYSSSDFTLIMYLMERFLYDHGLLDRLPIVAAELKSSSDAE